MKRHPAGILEVAGLFAQIKSRDFSVFGRFILPAKWACPSLEKGKKSCCRKDSDTVKHHGDSKNSTDRTLRRRLLGILLRVEIYLFQLTKLDW
jgi:hypothetical protein